MREEIGKLRKLLETENLVSERIKRYVGEKTTLMNSRADEQEKVKEKKVDVLEKEKGEIDHFKEEDQNEINRMHLLIN